MRKKIVLCVLLLLTIGAAVGGWRWWTVGRFV
jgi:multidrug resistance efflux pump